MPRAMILGRISWLGHTSIVFETSNPFWNSFLPLRVMDEAARWIGHAFSLGPEQNAGERYDMPQK